MEKIQAIVHQTLVHSKNGTSLTISRDVAEKFKNIIGKRKITYSESESELIIKIEKEAN